MTPTPSELAARTGDVMAENLLKWLRCLNGEDRRAIGYAMLHHAAENALSKSSHYQAADAQELPFWIVRRS
jgi:hypothetical protein